MDINNYLKPVWLSSLLCLFSLMVHAQELRCTVQVNSSQVEGSSKELFDNLQQSVTDFLNTTQWTNLTFQETERIDCSMMIIIKQVTTEGLLTGEMQLQCRRPVYSTSYFTPIINLKDDNFSFKYQAFDRLDYQQNTFTTNLSAMLAYYAYLIIGYDLDSYSRMGGQPCFEHCEAIVNAAQSASLEDAEMSGWTTFMKGSNGNRNRYALINNIMDEAFSSYRNYFYDYHRLGMDEMAANMSNARAKIASGMTVLKDCYRARPATYIINTFLDAKADELVNIFSQAPADEKKTVYNLLMDIDPTRQNTYDRINEKQ